jgi:uncharacterized membrane protein YciS (DUF1049 family)
MRVICTVFLVAAVAVVAAFAAQNRGEVTLTFFDYHATYSIAAVVGAAYVLGMVSGWTVLGILRRSFERAAELPADRRRTMA